MCVLSCHKLASAPAVVNFLLDTRVSRLYSTIQCLSVGVPALRSRSHCLQTSPALILLMKGSFDIMRCWTSSGTSKMCVLGFFGGMPVIALDCQVLQSHATAFSRPLKLLCRACIWLPALHAIRYNSESQLRYSATQLRLQDGKRPSDSHPRREGSGKALSNKVAC